MKSSVGRGISAAALSLAFGVLGSSPANADNHALIMTIGNYADPGAALPGIDLDAKLAAGIARAMGVPDSRITFLSDKQLTQAGIGSAFAQLNQKISRGDNVFIYYSGHGGQQSAGEGKCTEGLVSYDMRLYKDTELERVLGEISGKAGQVVVMNDSCFSGGAAQFKSVSSNRKPKLWKAAGSDAYVCGEAINMKLTRNLLPLAARKGANLLYIAAAQDNEVADATPNGSAATVAWKGCLAGGTDINRSGLLTGEEMRTCAQNYLDSNRHNHHITLVGNKELPVAFAMSDTYADTVARSGPVAGAAAFQDLRNGASPTMQVSLQLGKPQLRIGQDVLDFSVTTQHGGYLTILQVGSDGQTFNRLFPNDIDQNNFLNPGTVRLPRPSWMLKAGGPAGTSYLMAIVSETQRDFAKGLQRAGAFATGSGALAAKNLYVGATGIDQTDAGRYGASDVMPVHEY